MILIDNSDVCKFPTIPIICGPTGSGKSSVVAELARKFNIVVISADSRQVVRFFDIGTAKPTEEERKELPHYLIDIVDPGEPYSAFRFISDADESIKRVFENSQMPVVVGGTGLYLRALTEGLVEVEASDPILRERLESEMDSIGSEKMHIRLSKIDPEQAEAIPTQNRARIIRALEIFELTGQTKTELSRHGSYKKSQFRYAFYRLMPDREALYEAINSRVDRMIESGWPEEVGSLVERFGVARIRKSNVIGYMELLRYHENEISIDDAIGLIKQNTRRFAKRQMTWFRNQTPDASHHTTRNSLVEALSEFIEKNRFPIQKS